MSRIGHMLRALPHLRPHGDDEPQTGIRTQAHRPRLQDFQEPMVALAERAARVDVRSFETSPAEHCHADLHPIARDLTQDAQALLARILHACENPRASAPDLGEGPGLQEPFLPFEHALDAAVEAADPSVRAVEDVAFLVQLELRQRADRLRRLTPTSSAATILGECDSALRRIRKGLGAIDVGIARAESVPARLDFSSELEVSLLVRSAYAKFRLGLVDGPPQSRAELHARMRAAGTRLAMLVGWSTYPLLRVRDRLQLRELQSRILAWLHPENRSDELAGTRIWQDVVGFVAMLTQVNRRQELVAHDRRAISTLLEHVAAHGAELDDAITLELRSLEGLDDDLDRWMHTKPRPALAPVEILEHLGVRFGLGDEAGIDG